MNIFLRMLCLVTLLTSAFAVLSKQYFTHNFLQPKYHGKRLNYCMLGESGCGDVVAQKYCHILGFKRADKYIKAHNVGLTNYIDGNWQCKGWKCNGFSQIRCVDELRHPPAESYHYRYKRFAFPRFDNYRLGWCYKSHTGCGYRAAYSFCRQVGYMKVKHYEKETQVAATKAIGDKALCFGKQCNGFRAIQCQR